MSMHIGLAPCMKLLHRLFQQHTRARLSTTQSNGEPAIPAMIGSAPGPTDQSAGEMLKIRKLERRHTTTAVAGVFLSLSSQLGCGILIELEGDVTTCSDLTVWVRRARN